MKTHFFTLYLFKKNLLRAPLAPIVRHFPANFQGGGGGLGWVGLGQGLAWSPNHGPRRLPCGTRLGGRTRVSGHKAYRTVDRPQTPRWRSRAGDAAVPVCMCPCVSEGGGGRAVAHLLAQLLFGVGAHGAGKCVPGAPGPGREAGEPDAEPAGGDVGLGSQPPRHKDMLPNHSTTAYWHGKAVVRGTTGVRPALLDCLRHRWCCLAGWVRLPRPRAYPGQVEGHQGAQCASLPWVPPVLAALAAALQPA